MNESIRTFIAVAIPEEVKKEIIAAQAELRDQIGAENKIRWASPEQFHLTLRFLGNIPATSLQELEAALRAAASSVSPFQLYVAGCGCFPSFANPRVVWAGVTGEIEPLATLQKKIQEATAHLGEPPETRTFKAHLTLARVKADSMSILRKIGLTTREFKYRPTAEWTVREVQLIRSDLSPNGSSYTVLASIPLSGA